MVDIIEYEADRSFDEDYLSSLVVVLLRMAKTFAFVALLLLMVAFVVSTIVVVLIICILVDR